MNLATNRKTEGKRVSFLGALFHGVAFYVFMAIFIVGVALGFKIYAQEKNVDVVMSNSTGLKLGDTVTLEFSTKMLKRSIEESLTIEPALKIETDWQDADIFKITLMESPIPETTYQVVIGNAKTQFYVPQQKITRKISSVYIPQIKTVYPSNEQVEIDISEHIVIDFDQTIEKPFNVEVKVVPMTTNFNYKLNDTRTQLVITPELKMDKKTEYSLVVKIKHKYLDFAKEMYQGKFTTKVPPQVFYSYGGGNVKRITETRLEDVEPQILEGNYVDIDLSSQTMFIFQDGKEKGAFKVSTGKRGMDTPRGTFNVMGKSSRPWSQTYGLYMPWFIQFTSQGHGIHELPEWPSGYKEGTNHLGVPVSHGCVRLGIGPAKTVYDFVTIGMLIVVHN